MTEEEEGESGGGVGDDDDNDDDDVDDDGCRLMWNIIKAGMMSSNINCHMYTQEVQLFVSNMRKCI